MEQVVAFTPESVVVLRGIGTNLDLYEREMDGFRRAHAKVAGALRSAAVRHGLDGLELYPRAEIPCRELRVESRSVFGVRAQVPAWGTGERRKPAPAVNASPEAEEFRDSFLDLVLRAARIAVHAGNLERLRREYSRTARRARALEDVLLPEIDDSLAVIGVVLEELERADAIRVRQVRTGP
jgi:V/A-type H+-transporting ATPase subunit D